MDTSFAGDLNGILKRGDFGIGLIHSDGVRDEAFNRRPFPRDGGIVWGVSSFKRFAGHKIAIEILTGNELEEFVLRGLVQRRDALCAANTLFFNEFCQRGIRDACDKTCGGSAVASRKMIFF